MRIPVNSCEGCNKKNPIGRMGHHRMARAMNIRCKFVAAEMVDISPTARLEGVFNSKPEALKFASKKPGAMLHWIGQAPINMWMVLTDTGRL